MSREAEMRLSCAKKRAATGYHRTLGPVPVSTGEVIVDRLPPPPHFAWLIRELKSVPRDTSTTTRPPTEGAA